jgi:hypothetical protein
MGCTSSSLAGDDFKNIDATALSSEQAPRHSTKPVAEGEDDATANAKAKDHAENEKRFGSNAHKAGLPFAGKPRELKKKLPAGERAKNEEFVDRAAQLDKPILRTDEDRVARVEAEGKKLSPYQRWTNKRLGVGEGESVSVSEYRVFGGERSEEAEEWSHERISASLRSWGLH